MWMNGWTCVCMVPQCRIWGELPPSAKDRLRLLHNPDQDKAVFAAMNMQFGEFLFKSVIYVIIMNIFF